MPKALNQRDLASDRTREKESPDAGKYDDFRSAQLEETVLDSIEPPSSTPMTRELRNLHLSPTSKLCPAHARLETVLPVQKLSSVEQELLKTYYQLFSNEQFSKKQGNGLPG